MSLYLDVIMAGFGGQGVMLIGNLLAYAGMEQGLNVTYIPVYGPEMRGGTANCTVVLSDDVIGSPIIPRPKSLIVMNRPSLDKFQPQLEDGGVLVINSSLVDPALAEADRVRLVTVPANEIADSLGNTRMANMVALGRLREGYRRGLHGRGGKKPGTRHRQALQPSCSEKRRGPAGRRFVQGIGGESDASGGQERRCLSGPHRRGDHPPGPLLRGHGRISFETIESFWGGWGSREGTPFFKKGSPPPIPARFSRELA